LSFIPDVAATATASTPLHLSRSARREIYGLSGGRQQPDAKSLRRRRPGGQNGNVAGREGSGSKPESGKLRRTGFGRIKLVFFFVVAENKLERLSSSDQSYFSIYGQGSML
jgi:hypothetical protein